MIILYLSLTFIISFFHTKDPRIDFKGKKICLLIAHPDDESMFFGPLLCHLAKIDCQVFILCMTRGNYYNQGSRRVQEMHLACRHMFNHSYDLRIIDEDDKIPDHSTKKWDEKLATTLISAYLKENLIQTIVTFDQFGISGHPNHCSLNKLVNKCEYLPFVEIWQLVTVNRARKYIPLLDLIFSLRENYLIVGSLQDYFKILGMMLKHKSQLVWFRWLYLITSRYMFINSFEKIY